MIETQTMLSRVADSLYWMSRYLERAENTARLVDVYTNVSLDVPEAVERQRLRRLQAGLSLPVQDQVDTDTLLQNLAFGTDNPASISVNIAAVRENARQVREQISSEMWTQINKHYLDVRYAKIDGIWAESPHDFFLKVEEGSHLFYGICDATMNHNQGWHFIQIGRYIERVMGLLQMLSVQIDPSALGAYDEFGTTRYFELVAILKSVCAFEAYCKVYNANLQTGWITEFLLFNREFPRSLRFCVEMISASLGTLADATGRSKNSRLYRLAGRLQSTISYDEIADVRDLRGYLEGIQQQIGQIHTLLFDTFITYSIDSAL